MKKVLLSLLMATALVACGEKSDTSKGNEKPVVKIGAVLPITGSSSVLGASQKAGILAAIKDKTKEENKYIYEAVFEDNQHLPAKSATIANKFIFQDKSDILFTFTTGVGRVVAPIAERSSVLHLCATLEDKNAQPFGNTTFFQGPTIQSYNEKLINILKKRGVKKIAMFASNFGVACIGTERLGDSLRKLGIDVKTECFNPTDRDFRMAIQASIAQGYDDFYLQFFPPQSDIWVRQLKEQNVAPERIYGSGIDTGSDVSVFDGINHLGGASGSPAFVDRLMSEYNIDNVYMAAASYDLISLAIDAFENVEEKSTEKVLNYIKANASRECVSGYCELLENGFIANKAELRTYKDGKPVRID